MLYNVTFKVIAESLKNCIQNPEIIPKLHLALFYEEWWPLIVICLRIRFVWKASQIITFTIKQTEWNKIDHAKPFAGKHLQMKYSSCSYQKYFTMYMSM